jgi:glycosyltransferase involved in cell wall biosynthesis
LSPCSASRRRPDRAADSALEIVPRFDHSWRFANQEANPTPPTLDFAVPRFSIVTPTLNQAGTIRQTIGSVLGQDFRDLDYWVFDAGSADGTIDILRSFESDARFHWISEPDRGQSDAIDKGLARATGDFFNWLNSDDYLAPGALRLLAETWEKRPDAHIVSGRTSEFRGDPPEVFNTIELPLRDSAEASINVGVYNQPGTFWRTEFFREFGGVDPALHCMMDWNLWARYLARHGQEHVVRIEPVCAYFRHHAAAKTSALGERFHAEAKTIFQNLLLTLDAPRDFLLPEAQLDRAWERRPFELGPAFSRDLYLGNYAERMVRVNRRKNPALAKLWLSRAFRYPPRLTFWRIKMWLRLLFR